MIDDIKDFYKDRKVFITGHTGFKGSWLTIWLKNMGAKICGYSLEPDLKPNLFSELKLEEGIEHNIGDIRDFEKLKKCLKEFQPEVVFHLAAQPLVRLSYDDPRMTYETNVIGTLNVYEAIRETNSVKSVVSITTDKCYENKEWVYGYRENDPMGGYDPYSSSKGCAELLSASYRNSYFNTNDYGKKHTVSLATARAGNVIGGGDWSKNRLIPDCAKSLLSNKDIEIRSPNATRPWQHVMEPLWGYMLLGERLYNKGTEYAEGWNFGPDDSGVLTVKEVVDEVIKNWGYGEIIVNSDNKLHEANLLKLDISKAKFKLNWKPVYTPQEAIKLSVEWFKSFSKLSCYEMLEYTLNQIKLFEEKLA